MANQSSKGEYIGNELELFAHADNWKNYWSSKIRPLLAETVLEVGAGIGTNLALLRQSTNRHWLALEPDSKQCEEISKRCAQEGVEIVNGTLNTLEPDTKFGSIIYIDVLEHIEPDQAELERAFNLLEVSGRLVILSPAHQTLFSPFDSAVGHFRRYNKASLSALRPANAKIEKLFYLDSVGCIASWLNARFLKSDLPTPRQIWVWDKLMVPLSRLLDPLLNFSLGKTIVMVITK